MLEEETYYDLNLLMHDYDMTFSDYEINYGLDLKITPIVSSFESRIAELKAELLTADKKMVSKIKKLINELYNVMLDEGGSRYWNPFEDDNYLYRNNFHLFEFDKLYHKLYGLTADDEIEDVLHRMAILKSIMWHDVVKEFNKNKK